MSVWRMADEMLGHRGGGGGGGLTGHGGHGRPSHGRPPQHRNPQGQGREHHERPDHDNHQAMRGHVQHGAKLGMEAGIYKAVALARAQVEAREQERASAFYTIGVPDPTTAIGIGASAALLQMTIPAGCTLKRVHARRRDEDNFLALSLSVGSQEMVKGQPSPLCGWLQDVSREDSATPLINRTFSTAITVTGAILNVSGALNFFGGIAFAVIDPNACILHQQSYPQAHLTGLGRLSAGLLHYVNGLTQSQDPQPALSRA